MTLLTVGLELEWADVDRRTPIPPELGEWDTDDYTIVNSDGTANDPTGKATPYGGEINTRPGQPHEQVEIVAQLAALLNPTVNYRCNLHVHVGVPGLRDNLDALKQVLAWFRREETTIFQLVDPLPRPYFDDPLIQAGALKRWRRSLVSRHHRLPQARVDEALAAATPQAFYEAHAPRDRAGNRAWFIAPRPGINLRSLWKHGTIEYRHFPGTADPDEIDSATFWCQQITAAALADAPFDAWAIHATCGPWTFPRQLPYDHHLETGYQATKHRP